MAFPKLNSELELSSGDSSVTAEELAALFRTLAVGDEASQVLLVVGANGAGIAKAEGLDGKQELKKVVDATKDALIDLMRSPDGADKSLGMDLAWAYYQGVRSVRYAAAESSK